MSLSRLAVRLCAVRAIRGSTLAEGRVVDSNIGDLESKLDETTAPVVLVYTDEDDAKLQAKTPWASGGSISLVLVLAFANRASFEVEDKDGVQHVFVFADEDAGLEASLDIMERQVKTALHDTRDPWAKLFQRFLIGYDIWKSERGASMEKGARIAARQITIKLQALGDIPPGQYDSAPDAWGEFVALLRAEDGAEGMADLVEILITGRGVLPAWEQTAIEFGMSRQGVANVGISAPEGDGEAQPLTDLVIDDATGEDEP